MFSFDKDQDFQDILETYESTIHECSGVADVAMVVVEYAEHLREWAAANGNDLSESVGLYVQTIQDMAGHFSAICELDADAAEHAENAG